MDLFLDWWLKLSDTPPVETQPIEEWELIEYRPHISGYTELEKVSFAPGQYRGDRFKSIIDKSKRQVNASKSDGSQAITAKTRQLVWEKYFGDSQIGHCWCCKNIFNFDMSWYSDQSKTSLCKNPSWHCGHIVARKCGGTRFVENLRPICSQCNIAMGIKNMDEFVISNGLDSAQLLHKDDPFNRVYKEVSILTSYVEGILLLLVRRKYLTRTEAKNYSAQITSSKKDLSERVSIMHNICQYYDRCQHLLS